MKYASSFPAAARLMMLASCCVAAGVLSGCHNSGTSADGSGEAMIDEGGSSSGMRGGRPMPTIMEKGEAAYRGHDYEAARIQFAEAVDRDPGSPSARYWLGRSLLGLGKPAEAREQLEVALAADVENENIYAALCEALYQDKKLDELSRLLRQRATEHGTVADYTLLAHYSQLTGDMDEAQNALLTAARLDQGRNIGPQLALADFYLAVGNEPEASRRMRMAYYIDSTNERVQQKLKQFGHRLGPGLGLKPLERP